MTTFSRVITIGGMALLFGIAIPVWAESAPVYDADSMQQQFESSGDQGASELPPPPPPPEQENAFVPAQQPSTGSISTSSMSADQRMRRMEQQINAMQNSDSSSRLESLQSQVQTLRGQVEQLSHQLEQAQAQQKTQYSDLDKRVTQSAKPLTPVADNISVAKPARKSAAKPATDETAAEPVPAKSAANQPNVAEEQQIYQTAYDLIKQKKYSDAVTALQGMLKKYPSGQFASNAHYWLGELYGLMGKNDQALTEFSTVVGTFPDSPRVSDAQLKIGLIYASQTKWPDAKTAFKKVINKYPGTSSSRLASEQLKQIKQAGH